MAEVPQIGEKTKITLDLKTIGMVVGFVQSHCQQCGLL